MNKNKYLKEVYKVGYKVGHVGNDKKKRGLLGSVAYFCGQLIGISIVVFCTTVILAAMWNLWVWLT